MTRPVGSFNAEDKIAFEKFIRLEVAGYTTAEIIEELWGKTKENCSTFNSYEHKISRFRHHPAYNDAWYRAMGDLGKELLRTGVRKLRDQMKSGNEWLENKAANDVVNFAKPRVFGNEENTVTVKFEGMPEIGTPERLEE